MKKQIAVLFSIFPHPKRTMQELPSNKLYAMAILYPLYFAMARAFRPRNQAILQKELGGNLQIILFVLVITIILIPICGWIMHQFLKLFNKRLSVRKILNINAYAHTPRFVVAGIGYIVMFTKPSVFTSDKPSILLLVLIALGLIAMAYSIFLNIYGYVVSPSEDKSAANNEIEKTKRTLTSISPEILND